MLICIGKGFNVFQCKIVEKVINYTHEQVS